MNVDWNWIKQRPQYIAEELMKKYDVYVVYQYRYSRKGYQKRNLSNNIIAMKPVPRIDRYQYLRWINLLYKRKFISHLINKIKPDYIYITFPEQIEWLPDKISAAMIYDCMDDHCGLAVNDNIKKRIFRDEKLLCAKSNYILVSSIALKSIIENRYSKKYSDKISLVRNGYNGEILSNSITIRNNRVFTLFYFGTVAEWFDFELINKSLDEFDQIQYVIAGPVLRNVHIPQNSRIKYIGTIEHDKLKEKTRNADCFIMPFKLSPSIRAVDPVKLYEYINFNKNIICISYEEVERFSKYAFLYSNYDEYERILKNLINDNTVKYSESERAEFLSNNSWRNRAEDIEKLIGDI